MTQKGTDQRRWDEWLRISFPIYPERRQQYGTVNLQVHIAVNDVNPLNSFMQKRTVVAGCNPVRIPPARKNTSV